MVMENRYDKYKDSGIAWIGEIPEHWEICKLSTLFFQHKQKNNDNQESNLLSLSYGNIKRKDINTSEGLLPESFDNYNIIDKDDIVFRLTDLQNDKKSLRSALCKERGIITSAYVTIRKRSNINSSYFNYLFRAYDECKVFYGLGEGVRQSMNFDDLRELEILLPEQTIQKSIATYLDQKCGEIDELITLQEEMITKLQSYKQSVITEAVTKGLDKNVPLKDSGIEWIGEIPEHWKVKRLKNVCSTNNASLSDKTSKEFEFDYVDIGSVSFELGIHKTERYTFQNAPSRARKIARLGDIIVSTVRTYLRAIDIINSEEKEKYIYSTGFAILSPLKNILSEFMIYICRSEYFTNLVSIYSTGINYPSINDTALKMINIVIPPIHEQQSIADYLDQKCSEIDELISIKQQKIEKLKDYKKSLIFECVTGKRKV